jgi:cell division initiation protein
MKITPLDIQQKQFRVRFRGFDIEEVDSFLEIVREEMENLIRENSDYREKVRRLEEKVKEYHDMEETMKGILVSGQQMIEDKKNSARQEAELVKRDAELKAREVLQDAEERLVRIHEDVVELKRIRRHFREEVSRLIDNYKKMIEFDEEREAEISGDIKK